MSIHLKDRIKAMSLDLPPAPEPSGVYRPILIVENHLYVSGQGPVLSDGKTVGFEDHPVEFRRGGAKYRVVQGQYTPGQVHYASHFLQGSGEV